MIDTVQVKSGCPHAAGTPTSVLSVGVRDSKDRHGPVLTFTTTAWTAFVTFTAVSRPVQ
ncbi:hypothetical protein DLJ58_13630 [Micromonospora arida]|uniref:DUF397 domain-containing protein n=1 Tax=Micromonospora arida TaxID=2203715 RepID=A0A3N9X9J2_9ACTN|nr:hypothetical protein DLJ58_13630 [Micromonospora arida]